MKDQQHLVHLLISFCDAKNKESKEFFASEFLWNLNHELTEDNEVTKSLITNLMIAASKEEISIRKYAANIFIKTLTKL